MLGDALRCAACVHLGTISHKVYGKVAVFGCEGELWFCMEDEQGNDWLRYLDQLSDLEITQQIQTNFALYKLGAECLT